PDQRHPHLPAGRGGAEGDGPAAGRYDRGAERGLLSQPLSPEPDRLHRYVPGRRDDRQRRLAQSPPGPQGNRSGAPRAYARRLARVPAPRTRAASLTPASRGLSVAARRASLSPFRPSSARSNARSYRGRQSFGLSSTARDISARADA